MLSKIFQFQNIYTKWILLALMLVAAILRYFTLTTTSFTIEEQELWAAASSGSIIDSISYINQVKPFSLLLGWTNWLFCWEGIYIEFFSRLVSFISSVLAVPLIFILSRKFYSETEGLIASSLIAFSWVCISTSQEISQYSLLLSFSIFYFIALITFLDRVSEEQIFNQIDTFLLVISGLLLGLLSVWGIMLVVVSFFYSFFFIKKINTFLRVTQRFLYILLPLSLLLLLNFNRPIIYSLYTPQWTDYIASFNYIITNNYLLSVIVILLLLYLGGVYIGRISSKEEKGEDAKTSFNNSTLVITICLVGSIIGFVLITFLLKFEFSRNDLIIFLIPLFLLLSRAIVLVSTKLKTQIILGSILAIVFLISTIINLEEINNKPEYDQVFRFIKTSSVYDYQRYGLVYTSLMHQNDFYYKKYDIRFPQVVLKKDIKEIDDSGVLGIGVYWLINDNSINIENYIKELKINNKFDGGYRFRGVTIYKIIL